MILADNIINERKKNGWSQEELAEMMGVSRQSVSKWESAQSAPDLQKILKMAEIFEVTTDYLLKDEIEAETNDHSIYEEKASGSGLRTVTLEEASDFISLRKRNLPLIGLGVILCITCPALLIFLSGLTEVESLNFPENIAALIGLIVLFLQLIVAIFIFITQGSKLYKYNYLQEELFETAYGVDGMVKEKMTAEESTNRNALVAGVLLCVISPLPLIVTSLLGMPGYIVTSMVCILLMIVSIAVYLFISKCGPYSSYKMLLQIDSYTPAEKTRSKKISSLPGIYWISITFIYLAASFITDRWDMTWIIWAVSGLLFALIMIIAKSMVKTD